MSIATELDRIKAAKEAIKFAINAKGGTLTGDELLGAYADAIAALPSGGNSMDFYKCVTVYGPRKVERIRVSGAGTATVNGDYEKTDLTTLSGGEVWKHLTANCYLYNLDGYWCINLNGYATWGESAYYYTYNSDLTQWNVGYNWTDERPTGADPAPSVSKIQVTLDADAPKTWDGYKAILANGVYDFEKTLTTGLSYGSALTPVVGNIYSADASVKAVLWLKPLYTPDNSTVAYISFDDGTPTDLAGHLTNNEKGTEGNGFNNAGWSFNGGYVQIAPNGNEFVFGTNDFTMETYIYPVNTERQCIFAYENDGVFAVTFSYGGDGYISVFHSDSWSSHVMSNNALTLNQWHHVAFVRKAGELSLWINGEKQSTTLDLSGTNVGEAGQKFSIGRWGGDPGDFNKRWQGSMDEVRISNIARYGAGGGGGSGGVVNTYRISGCPSPAYDGDYQLTEQTSTLCTMIYKKVGDTEKHLVKTTNGQWIVGFYDPEGGYDSDAYLGQYRINSDDPVNGVWFDDAMGDDCPGMSCTVIN